MIGAIRGNGPLQGILLACGSLVLLGIMPVIANSRPAGFDALSFAFVLSVWQTVFALPLFAGELRARRGLFAARPATGATGRTEPPAAPAPDRRRSLLIGIGTGVLFGLSTWFYVLGVEKAGATNAAIAIQAYPLFAILLESLFLGRRKTPVELLLTGLLLGALYYLATGGTGRLTGISPWFCLALSVPLLWSIAHIIIRTELRTTPITPAQITFFRVAISAAFLLIVLALLMPERLGSDLADMLTSRHGVLMGLVYYLELIVWFHAMRHIDVSVASSITTPWPALTMVLAAVFLGDPIHAHQAVALVAVIACIYALALADLRKARAPVA